MISTDEQPETNTATESDDYKRGYEDGFFDGETKTNENWKRIFDEFYQRIETIFAKF